MLSHGSQAKLHTRMYRSREASSLTLLSLLLANAPWEKEIKTAVPCLLKSNVTRTFLMACDGSP